MADCKFVTRFEVMEDYSSRNVDNVHCGDSDEDGVAGVDDDTSGRQQKGLKGNSRVRVSSVEYRGQLVTWKWIIMKYRAERH